MEQRPPPSEELSGHTGRSKVRGLEHDFLRARSSELMALPDYEAGLTPPVPNSRTITTASTYNCKNNFTTAFTKDYGFEIGDLAYYFGPEEVRIVGISYGHLSVLVDRPEDIAAGRTGADIRPWNHETMSYWWLNLSVIGSNTSRDAIR